MFAVLRLTLRSAWRFLLLATGQTPGRARNASHLSLPTHFLDALLARHGLARSLAGAGVGPRPLAAHRQAAAVAQAAVAADVAQPGDVLGHLAAQGTFDGVLLVEDTRQPADLVVGQLARPPLRVDAGLRA